MTLHDIIVKQFAYHLVWQLSIPRKFEFGIVFVIFYSIKQHQQQQQKYGKLLNDGKQSGWYVVDYTIKCLVCNPIYIETERLTWKSLGVSLFTHSIEHSVDWLYTILQITQ